MVTVYIVRFEDNVVFAAFHNDLVLVKEKIWKKMEKVGLPTELIEIEGVESYASEVAASKECDKIMEHFGCTNWWRKNRKEPKWLKSLKEILRQERYYAYNKMYNRNYYNADYQRKWREEHPDYAANYYREHKEDNARRSMEWRKRHKDICNAYYKQYYKTHPEYRKRQNENARRRRKEKRLGIENIFPC